MASNNFDLRKFLAENKLTKTSKIVSERKTEVVKVQAVKTLGKKKIEDGEEDEFEREFEAGLTDAEILKRVKDGLDEKEYHLDTVELIDRPSDFVKESKTTIWDRLDEATIDLLRGDKEEELAKLKGDAPEPEEEPEVEVEPEVEIEPEVEDEPETDDEEFKHPKEMVNKALQSTFTVLDKYLEDGLPRINEEVLNKQWILDIVNFLKKPTSRRYLAKWMDNYPEVEQAAKGETSIALYHILITTIQHAYFYKYYLPQNPSASKSEIFKVSDHLADLLDDGDEELTNGAEEYYNYNTPQKQERIKDKEWSILDWEFKSTK